MQASLFVVLLMLLCGACAQTFVPLVPDSTNTTTLQGAFFPNGTLSAFGQSMTFYTTVKNVKNGQGISVYGGMISNVTLFFKKGGMASAADHDSTVSASCSSYSCYSFFDLGVGKCNPKNGDYYFTIQNSGTSPVKFALTVDIDEFGGSLVSCGFVSWLTHLFETAAKIMIAVLVIIILAIIACIAACCYCCCRKKRDQHYYAVPQDTVYVQTR